MRRSQTNADLQLAAPDSPNRSICGTHRGVYCFLVLGLMASLAAGCLRRRSHSAVGSEAAAYDPPHAGRDSTPAAPRLAYEVKQFGWLQALSNWPGYPASDAARAAAAAPESAGRATPDSTFGSALALVRPASERANGQGAWPHPRRGTAAQPASRQAETVRRPAAINELFASAQAFDSKRTKPLAGGKSLRCQSMALSSCASDTDLSAPVMIVPAGPRV